MISPYQDDSLLKTFNLNIPILPEAFLTFASKSSIGPSYAAHGPYTQCTLNDISEEIAQHTRYTVQHEKLFPQRS